jgi:hypothetical protein
MIASGRARREQQRDNLNHASCREFRNTIPHKSQRLVERMQKAKEPVSRGQWFPRKTADGKAERWPQEFAAIPKAR